MCQVEIDVNGCIDQAYRIYENIFHTGKNNTANTGYDRNKFKPARLLYIDGKLAVNFLYAQTKRFLPKIRV